MGEHSLSVTLCQWPNKQVIYRQPIGNFNVKLNFPAHHIPNIHKLISD
jgi:hypothetical protein